MGRSDDTLGRRVDDPLPWSDEQVESLAPSASMMSAARQLATPTRWRSTGADEGGVWGTVQGSGREPYETVVDHTEVVTRCTCPSRRLPCKHALALLLLFARGQIATGAPSRRTRAWLDRRRADAQPSVDDTTTGDNSSGEGSDDATGDPDNASPPDLPPRDDWDRARNERVESMSGALIELDRWLEDRLRTGLADPSLADYATWDQLAARLVDGRAGSLANRVRRLAGRVGIDADWQQQMLAELGVLHLLAQAGQRLGELPGPLADAVATTIGWQVRTADVLAGVPETDHWFVAGRSDAREDRLEVRRYWLYGTKSQRWALILSFAAYQQSLEHTFEVGDTVHADLHRYPGGALRALVGRRHDGANGLPGSGTEEAPGERAVFGGVAEAVAGVGALLASQPWLDRVPMLLRATVAQDRTRRMLTDSDGSVVLNVPPTAGRGVGAWTSLIAVSAGATVDIAAEWTPEGVVPLAVHLPHRSHDLGRRADASFVA
ncbi:MAG: SWIM zinc finger family protein [Ilumatobacteraceae bacterium]|nr:SWIM zinc finger family protein [Ilumatobacteraceae bacterium]